MNQLIRFKQDFKIKSKQKQTIQITFALCSALARVILLLHLNTKNEVKIIPVLYSEIVSSSNSFVVTVTYLASRCGNGFATSLKYSQKFLEGKYHLHHCNGLALVSLQFPEPS